MVVKTCFGSALVLAVLSAGCAHDDEITDTAPDKIAFTGKPDPKFAGTWKTQDGVSTYTIEPSGQYLLDSKIKVKGRDAIDSHLSGQWGVAGEQIQFKDQSGNVSQFTFTLKGSVLTVISNGSLKAKTVMNRVN